jgi:hypothetical protein
VEFAGVYVNDAANTAGIELAWVTAAAAAVYVDDAGVDDAVAHPAAAATTPTATARVSTSDAARLNDLMT